MSISDWSSDVCSSDLLQTEAVTEERKGPRADAPAQALEGFLRSTGLTRDQLVEREDNKGNSILFAVVEKPGRATTEVIAEIVPTIIRAFPWPKSMRWGKASQTTESLRWVRPLKGIRSEEHTSELQSLMRISY